jgi:putative heme-binding domain-containing protein
LDIQTRTGSLQALTESGYGNLDAVISKTIQSELPALRVQGLKALAKTDSTAFQRLFSDRGKSFGIPEQQLGLSLLGAMKTVLSESIIKSYLDRVIDGVIDARLILDVVEAASTHSGPSLTPSVTAYRRSLGSPREAQYHEAALEGGDADRGREVFNGHVVGQCVRCHDAGGGDLQVGPALQGIGNSKSREYLLESLIEPSVQLAEGYALTTILLKNQDVRSGRVAFESDTRRVLIDIAGERHELMKSNISSRSVARISTMPPMSEILTPFELRDLVEYLATWR